ncbi:hypothetical protein [Lentilactobacillus sp. Marseille-Q4993]|uniref:hypothetical protein n=1 Tax=Lentilactobacillus sp. Marseille-Q4993 TaxID=3039492 RepID=UPI0024BC5C20|nr:hypothetical protein [Lentilactobacillus sp. Marseille-Q4993]
MDSLRKELQQFRESETDAREKLSDDLNELNEKVIRNEVKVDEHDKDIKLIRSFLGTWSNGIDKVPKK